jgi:NADH dehydrogenase FAD-containing subunit
MLFNGVPRVLMLFRRASRQSATRSPDRLGVEMKCGEMVQHVDTDGLTIQSGERTDFVAAKTVIWVGGILASPWSNPSHSHECGDRQRKEEGSRYSRT